MGVEGLYCSLCETTVFLENVFDFLTCDDLKVNDFCGSYADCVEEQCNAECADLAYDYLYCILEEDDWDGFGGGCGLLCSPNNNGVVRVLYS